MRILVTGANGYLGQGIVLELLNMGIDVVATDFELEGVDSRAKKIEADLFTVEDPFAFFMCPDSILHLAWRDGFKHDSISHLSDLNKHYSFISKLLESGLKDLTVLGSMHEVGKHEGAVDENTPQMPLSLYGISKNALRQSIDILSRNYNFTCKWIRGYYIIGNTKKGCSIFSKITQAEEDGDEFFPFTSGKNKYDFIKYNDFCSQVSRTACQTKVTGIINCCSGKPVSLGEQVEDFINSMSFKIKLQYGVFPDRMYDSKAIWGDTSKINQIMNEWTSKNENEKNSL